MYTWDSVTKLFLTAQIVAPQNLGRWRIFLNIKVENHRNGEFSPNLGPMLWFFSIFSPKKSAKKLAFLTQNKAKFWKIYIISLVFEKNDNFFAEKGRKSQKIVIITSTPCHPDALATAEEFFSKKSIVWNGNKRLTLSALKLFCRCQKKSLFSVNWSTCLELVNARTWTDERLLQKRWFISNEVMRV
jgi:hypothetical protein